MGKEAGTRVRARVAGRRPDDFASPPSREELWRGSYHPPSTLARRTVRPGRTLIWVSIFVLRRVLATIIGMPLEYAKLGIHFQFPENWTLDESDALRGDESVSVYSPGGAFWSIIKHPRSALPHELVEAALQAMRQEYDELDVEEVKERVAGRELVGCDMNFYCLDLTNTALLRVFQTTEATYLVLCQADDREFATIEPVFQAMTRSLLS